MQLTRHAATTIQYSFRYFKIKKRFHLLRRKLNQEASPSKFMIEFDHMRRGIVDDRFARQPDSDTNQEAHSHQSRHSSKLDRLQCRMQEARVKLIQQVREFIHERNRMDTIIAEERRSMFTTQHETSKTVDRIDSNIEELQTTVREQQKMMKQMMRIIMNNMEGAKEVNEEFDEDKKISKLDKMRVTVALNNLGL